MEKSYSANMKAVFNKVLTDDGLSAALLAFIFLCTGFLVGFLAPFANIGVGGQWQAGPVSNAESFTVFSHILLRNGSLLCLLFSGAVTAGLTTIVAWPLVSLYIGGTMTSSVAALGWHQVFATISWYALLEFFALLLAAAAGVIPAFTVVKSVLFSNRTHGRLIPLYLGRLADSLRLLCAAGAIMLVSAAVETIVIALQGA